MSRDLQPRLLYPAKLSFRIERWIQSFPNKKKLKFITTKSVLRKKVKDLFKQKERDKNMHNKMATDTYLSTITLKAPVKGQRVTRWIVGNSPAWFQKL